MKDRWFRARVIEVKDVVIGGYFEEVEMDTEKQVRLWRIGEHSEVYSGHSEDEVKGFLAQLVGPEEAEEQVKDLFEEIPESEFDRGFSCYDDDTGVTRMTTWRSLIAEHATVPMQIATQYL